MIKIATPISHLFKDDVMGRRIAEVSDCLECREWCIDTEIPRQELIHYDININLPWDDHEREGLLRAFHSKKELKLVTFQMASDYMAPVIVDSMYRPGGVKLTREEMLFNVRVNSDWLKSSLGKQVIVGIENNNYYPTGAYDLVTDPSFIFEVITQNDLRLLLDIAHAKVSAHNKGLPIETYLAGLPLNRLIQIHICKPQIRSDGICMDAHDLPDDELNREVFEIGKKYPVQYLTIEFYKDGDQLIQCIETLKKVRNEMEKHHANT